MAYWPLHSNVCYLASGLAAAGWRIELFLCEASERFSGDLLPAGPAVTVHRIRSDRESAPGRKPGPFGAAEILRKIRDKAEGRFRRTRFATRVDDFWERVCRRLWPAYGLLPKGAAAAIVQEAKREPYFLLIGVEKGGLAWAGAVAARTRTPLCYYSLELYTWDHPWIKSSLWMQRFKVLEGRYHRRCAATLIQDQPRGEALLADNGVRSPMRMAYLPICLSGPPCQIPSRWLQDKLNLPAEEKLILSYGEVSERRLSLDLARLAQSFPQGWRLVFHGFGEAEAVDRIRAIDGGNRISLSLTLVPAQQRQELVRSAHVGLALYGRTNLNDTLTGMSSEKIAMYLQCGLPLIAFRYPSYEHIEAEGAGILIDRPEEIPAAVGRILGDYPAYVRNAFSCYRKHYCFEDNFGPVLAELAAAGGAP